MADVLELRFTTYMLDWFVWPLLDMLRDLLSLMACSFAGCYLWPGLHMSQSSARSMKRRPLRRYATQLSAPQNLSMLWRRSRCLLPSSQSGGQQPATRLATPSHNTVLVTPSWPVGRQAQLLLSHAAPQARLLLTHAAPQGQMLWLLQDGSHFQPVGARSEQETTAARRFAALPGGPALSLRRYGACTAAFSVRYKIHGHEPSQLLPGWEARLDRLARREGMCLTGSCVRAGCVELTLDLIVAAPGATSGCAGPQALLPGQGGEGLSGMGLSPGRVLEVAPILSALGLGEPADSAAPAVLEQVAHVERQVDSQSLQPLELPSAGVELRQQQRQGKKDGERADGGAPGVLVKVLGMEPAEPDAPRVLLLQPRVLLLSQAPTCLEQAQPQPEAPACSARSGEPAGCDRTSRPALQESGAVSTAEVPLRATVCHSASRGRGCGGSLHAPAVLVRGQNTFLPARVVRFQRAEAAVSDCGSSSSTCCCGGCGGGCGGDIYYELELMVCMPPRAGVVLLELCWDDQPGQVVPLLALHAADAAVASELLQLTAGPVTMTDNSAPASAPQQLPCFPTHEQQLDGLLLDLGVWAQAQGSPCPASSTPPRLHPRQRAVLGTNLLRFSLAMTLPATEAWVLGGLAQLELELAAAEALTLGTPAAGALSGCEAGREAQAAPVAQIANGAGTTAVRRKPAPRTDGARTGLDESDTKPKKCSGDQDLEAESSSEAVEGACDRGALALGKDGRSIGSVTTCGVTGGGRSSRRGERGAGRSGEAAVATWQWALQRALGWGAAEEAAEEEAYRAYVAPWVVNQEHIIQAFECLGLLVLLFRARAELFNPVHLVTLLGSLPGAATALAYLLLPHSAWARLVQAAKLPRYVTYIAAKALSVYLGLPLPPGYSSYTLGLGMVLHEGLLLPLSCLLPIRTALFITVAKVLPCAIMMLSNGVTTSRRQAGVRCALVAVVALPTTVLCHMYLRLCFAHWRRGGASGCGGGGIGGGRIRDVDGG